MARNLRLLVVLALANLLTPSAMAGQFCAVGNFGNAGPCFGVLSMCQNWVATSGGTCVFRETGGVSPTPAPGSMQEAYQAGQGLGLLLRALTEESEASKSAAKVEEESRRLEYQRQLEIERNTVNEARKKPQVENKVAPKVDLPEIEKICSAIGFKKGTPKFGDCVLELVRRHQ
jgi:hypothetical protein